MGELQVSIVLMHVIGIQMSRFISLCCPLLNSFTLKMLHNYFLLLLRLEVFALCSHLAQYLMATSLGRIIVKSGQFLSQLNCHIDCDLSTMKQISTRVTEAVAITQHFRGNFH